ncbi:MAG: GNAT family N-acetyltransferase [Burkholderiaceae bacterium]
MTADTPAPALALRPATPADAPLIADLHARSRASAYRGLLPDDYLDRAMPVEAAAHWTQRLPELAAGAGQALVAEIDGTPVGFVCMSAPDAQRSVYIENLHVMPGHKGGGIGTRLLAVAATWARERGATRLHLLVFEGNRAAIGFYESRGWRCVERLDDELGGHVLPALVYALPLDAGATG